MSRAVSALIIIIILALILLLIGMIGYHYVLKWNWTDSFYLAALTMAGLSLEAKPITTEQKIFVAIFTLLSVGFYLIVIAAIIACILEPYFREIERDNLRFDYFFLQNNPALKNRFTT